MQDFLAFRDAWRHHMTMRTVVPLYGVRLRAFRQKRGWTQAEASSRLGFAHRQSLAAAESGTRELSAQELVTAAQVFGVGLSHFSDPFVVSSEAEFCWRKSPTVSFDDIEQVEYRVGRILGAYRHVCRELGLETSRPRPDVGLGRRSDMDEAGAAGEALAGRLAASPRVGEGLAAAVEIELGVAVLNIDLPKGISGVACRLTGMDGIVINRGEAEGRRNFNLAHELFHILTWDCMPPKRVEDWGSNGGNVERGEAGQAHVDSRPSSSTEGALGGDRPAADAHVESLADAFASGLLMPRSRLASLAGVDQLPHDPTPLAEWLNGAATTLGVSSMALGRRLRSLERLEEEAFGRVMKSRLLTHNGAASPGALPPPFSKACVDALFCGIDGGVFPMETVIDVTGMDEGSLVGLAHGYGTACKLYANSGWEEIRGRLSQLTDYADGWDGEGSLTPSELTLTNAADFTRRAEAYGTALPKLRLYGDGEVEFAWSGEHAAASVAFLSDGNVVAYVRRSARQPMFKLDRPYAEVGSLMDLLAALSEAF